MRKVVAVFVLLSVIISCGCTPKEFGRVRRDLFVDGIVANCDIEVYTPDKITPFSVKDALSTLGYDYRESEDDNFSYALIDSTSWGEELDYALYAEISQDADIAEALERTDIFPIVDLFPYHSEATGDISLFRSYGDTSGDHYLAYVDAYDYSSSTSYKVILYRNEYTILALIALSDSILDPFCDSLGIPRYYEDHCYFDFGSGDISVVDNDSVFVYRQFEDNKAALDYFEEYYYDPYLDMCEDDDFDGFYRNDLHKATGEIEHDLGNGYASYEYADIYSGYITLNGEFDDPYHVYDYDYSFYIEEDFYGGIYLYDNVVIVIYTTSSSELKTEAIDALLTTFEYPLPPKK